MKFTFGVEQTQSAEKWGLGVVKGNRMILSVSVDDYCSTSKSGRKLHNQSEKGVPFR